MKTVIYNGKKYIVPFEYKYVAMDYNGSVWFYKNEPFRQGSGYTAQGDKLRADCISYNWENSLEKV